MTNIIQALLITMLSTNWVELKGLNIEALVVTKQNIVQVIWEGKTNQVVMSTEYSALPQTRSVSFMYFTNYVSIPYWQNFIATNNFIVTTNMLSY